MSEMETEKERGREDSWKYKRVVAALVACGYTEKYEEEFLENEMDDEIVQKCIDNPPEFDYYLCSIIPKIGHKFRFITEFKKTKGNEGETTSSSSTSSVEAEPEETDNDNNHDGENSRNQMAKLKLSQDPPKKENMQVDDILVEEESEAAENENDGEVEIENSRKQMTKASVTPESTDVEIDQSKVGVDFSCPDPSSGNLNATSSSKPQAESESSQLTDHNSTGSSSLNSATSRNQEWILPTEKIGVLPLDKMTDAESLEFILKQLEIPESEIPEFREESREFIELISGLPLALQQAVAYIKQEKELKSFVGKSFKMSDYVKEFKLSMEKFLSFSPVPPLDFSPTVFVTCNVTFKKIQKLSNGKEAVKILEILPFLYADKIPLSFLRVLVPEMNNEGFSRALKLLEKYSMIKVNVSVRDFCLSIHRQLQFLILHSLKESNNVSRVVMNLVEKYLVILENTKLSKTSDILLNMCQIVQNHFDLIPVTEQFFNFVSELGDALFNTSQYSESLELFKKFYNKSVELSGENHENTLAAQQNIAKSLEELGRYEESLTLYKEVLEKQQTLDPDLGANHPAVFITKHRIAQVLQKQGQLGESLELYQQVLAHRTKILGKNHPKTFSVQNQIALVHLERGDLAQAHSWFQQLEKKQIRVLGPRHRDVLWTKHSKALVFCKAGQFQEASKILNEVHEERKQLFGENHLDTIDTLEPIAIVLEKEGKLEEALKLYEKVYKKRQVDLGEDHEKTIDMKSKIESVEIKLREENPQVL